MTAQLVAWYTARAAALAAFAVLAAALLTGMALRTSLLRGLAANRAVRDLHAFLSWFWVPLLALHVGALLLDGTARVGILDLVVPFRVAYAPVAVGLGTVALLLLLLVGVTSALRSRLSPRLWRVVHRLAYPMLVLMTVHAQLAGSDFGRVAVSVTGWAVLGALLAVAATRLAGARVAVAADGARPNASTPGA